MSIDVSLWAVMDQFVTMWFLPSLCVQMDFFFFFGQHLFFNTGIHPTEKNKKAWSEQGGIKGHKIIRKEKKHSLIQNGRDTRGYRRLESSDNS